MQFSQPSINGVSEWNHCFGEGSFGRMDLWLGTVTGAENNVLTASITTGTPTHSFVSYSEWSSLNTTVTVSPLVQYGNSSTIEFPSTGNTMSVDAGYLMCVMFNTAGYISSYNEPPGGGWGLLRSDTYYPNGPTFGSEYYVAPSTGTYTIPTMTLSSSAAWDLVGFQLID